MPLEQLLKKIEEFESRRSVTAEELRTLESLLSQKIMPGRIVSDSLCSDIDALQKIYDGIVAFVKKNMQEAPARGLPAADYADILREEIERASRFAKLAALKGFMRVTSRGERFAAQLLPFKEKASAFVARLEGGDWSGVADEDIRPFAIFLEILNCRSPQRELIEQAAEYFPQQVQWGLSGHYYYLEAAQQEEDADVALLPAAAGNEKAGKPVSNTEKISHEPEQLPLPVFDDDMLALSRKEDRDVLRMTIGTILPKSGNTEAFRQEVLELRASHPGSEVVLALLVKYGLMTEDMLCNAPLGWNRELDAHAVHAALDVLVDRGHVIGYCVEGNTVFALSPRCCTLMRKNTVVYMEPNVEDFWGVAPLYGDFCLQAEPDRNEVMHVLRLNGMYISAHNRIDRLLKEHGNEDNLYMCGLETSSNPYPVVRFEWDDKVFFCRLYEPDRADYDDGAYDALFVPPDLKDPEVPKVVRERFSRVFYYKNGRVSLIGSAGAQDEWRLAGGRIVSVSGTACATNSIKIGPANVAPFLKALQKVANRYECVRVFLPILTETGVIAEEDLPMLEEPLCSSFDGGPLTVLVEELVKKGWLSRYEYERHGKPFCCYALSPYCDECLHKASVKAYKTPFGRGFWLGNIVNNPLIGGRELDLDDIEFQIRISHNALNMICFGEKIKRSFPDAGIELKDSCFTPECNLTIIYVPFEGRKYECVVYVPEILKVKRSSIILDGEAIDAILVAGGMPGEDEVPSGFWEGFSDVFWFEGTELRHEAHEHAAFTADEDDAPESEDMDNNEGLENGISSLMKEASLFVPGRTEKERHIVSLFDTSFILPDNNFVTYAPNTTDFRSAIMRLVADFPHIRFLLPLLTELNALTEEQAVRMSDMWSKEVPSSAPAGKMLEHLVENGWLLKFSLDGGYCYEIAPGCREALQKNGVKKMKMHSEPFWKGTIQRFDKQVHRNVREAEAALRKWIKDTDVYIDAMRSVREFARYPALAFEICEMIDATSGGYCIVDINYCGGKVRCVLYNRHMNYLGMRAADLFVAGPLPGGSRAFLETFDRVFYVAGGQLCLLDFGYDEASSADDGRQDAPVLQEEPAALPAQAAANDSVRGVTQTETVNAVSDVSVPAGIKTSPVAVSEASQDAVIEANAAVAEKIGRLAEDVPGGASVTPPAPEDVNEPGAVIGLGVADAAADEAEAVVVQAEMLPRMLHTLGRIPTDDEFCDCVRHLLNVRDPDRLCLDRIVDAVLLAHAGAMTEGYSSIQRISMQLRLATAVPLSDEDRKLYTGRTLGTYFDGSDDRCLKLAAYALAMLQPAQAYDYELKHQTQAFCSDFDVAFPGLRAFKTLFEALMKVWNTVPQGIDMYTMDVLGDGDSSRAYADRMKGEAEKYFSYSVPLKGLRDLPILYNKCFGRGSDLYGCMEIIATNDTSRRDEVELVLSDYCDEGTNNIDQERIGDKLDSYWADLCGKNPFPLKYDIRSLTLKNFRCRLEVMKTWIEHEQTDVPELRKLRDSILDGVRKAQSDNSWKALEGADVLASMLERVRRTVAGDGNPVQDTFASLPAKGAISQTDDGYPLLDPRFATVKGYEPWRLVLEHIAAKKLSYEEVRSNVFNEDSEYFDNLHQLEMCARLVKDEKGAQEARDLRKDAARTAEADETSFRERLELAYLYDRIDENGKESMSRMIAEFRDELFEIGDFANWRRFIKALDSQVAEYEASRGQELRGRLDDRLKKAHSSTMLIEAEKRLTEKNFAVAEEYLNRFDAGETEFLLKEPADMDYFADFTNENVFRPLYDLCHKNSGSPLIKFAGDYFAMLRSRNPDFTNNMQRDAERYLENWPVRQYTATEAQITSLFAKLGLNAEKAEKVRKEDTVGNEVFRLHIRPVAKSMRHYPHPIAVFGTQVNSPVNVIALYGNKNAQQIVGTITNPDLRLHGFSVVLVDGCIDLPQRRYMAEIFHDRAKGAVPFLLIDRVLALYLAGFPQNERVCALLRCTLPYTRYQPFVNGSGAIADEMFCGRQRELDAILDFKGPCVVYGGRQLGKTALLQRAESIYHIPKDGQYSVYVNVCDEDTEEGFVERICSGLRIKTAGLAELKCKTIRDLCVRLDEAFAANRFNSLLLLIDECDRFLKSVSDKGYRVLNPMADLRRRRGSSFKFVLAGLHNVCRAHKATADNGVFGQLGSPLCIKPLAPADALALLSHPLQYLGFRTDSVPQFETVLTKTNYYPGILQFFGYNLVETLTHDYRKYYDAEHGNPPFTLSEAHLGSVLNSAALNENIKEKFRLSLELDDRYFMIARIMVLLPFLTDDAADSYGWRGYPASRIMDMSKQLGIQCLKYENASSFTVLLDEMAEMMILSKPEPGLYRLRRSSFADIIGTNPDILFQDIVESDEKQGGTGNV